MASKAMWEVDPETRSKLLAIQKESGNNLCCDCNAPSPQWASPKFGIFICLSCAGVHRGLGVHISFVRSISMDAFKQTEIERMRLGGNDNWKKFFDEHEDTQMRGLTWDDATIAERYNGVAGEEWKERLSAKVEGREYVPGERKTTPAPAAAKSAGGNGSRSATPLSGTAGGTTRSQSPGNVGGKAKVDDKYFESLGAANAARPDDLPPSQGGKYAGFGSTPAPKKEEGLPKLEELQKDPLAALTKGLGWFSSTVTKTATTVNKDFIQPTTKQIGESDFAAQARTFGGRLAQSAQAGAKTAQEGFTKFVEGSDGRGPTSPRTVPLDESKKAFWDNFASSADQRKTAGSSIGTSAMGKGSSGGPAAAANKKSQDEWDDW